MHKVKVKSILSSDNGMNIYRGCSHGCIYCDSRSTCYNFSHFFEDIEVKENAPELLENALGRKRKKCMIGTGSMCDPYLHLERELRLTRQCLEIIERYGFGVSVLTKSSMVLRDIDLYKRINNRAKALVQMTMTTFDDALTSIIEPNVSSTRERYETLLEFRREGIPSMVWLSPVLPFINDDIENLRGILDYCIDAGVKGIVCFGFGLTLRDGDREYFYSALDRHFPGVKSEYIKKYGNAYELTSPNNSVLMHYLQETCERYGIMYDTDNCFRFMKELPEKYVQQSLFE